MNAGTGQSAEFGPLRQRSSRPCLTTTIGAAKVFFNEHGAERKTMSLRSRQSLFWTAIIVVFGLVIRRAPLHLPMSVTKYGGSLLWGAMVYAIFVAILPSRRPFEVGLVASVFALAVEFFKLVHTPALDAFRLTLAGQLLIGRFFSYADIVAYLIAIFLFVVADSAQRKRSKPLSA